MVIIIIVLLEENVIDLKKLWQVLIHWVKIKISKQNEMQMVQIDLKIMVYQRLIKNLHKIKSQIRESVSHKYFTNQLRSCVKQLKQNGSSHKNLQSFWLISWSAVLYNNDINHCLSMISPICSLDYNDIHDKNHKKYHETEGEITVVTRESQQPKSRERRSSQSKEKEQTTTYFSM